MHLLSVEAIIEFALERMNKLIGCLWFHEHDINKQHHIHNPLY